MPPPPGSLTRLPTGGMHCPLLRSSDPFSTLTAFRCLDLGSSTRLSQLLICEFICLKVTKPATHRPGAFRYLHSQAGLHSPPRASSFLPGNRCLVNKKMLGTHLPGPPVLSTSLFRMCFAAHTLVSILPPSMGELRRCGNCYQTFGIARCSGLGPEPPGSHAGCTPGKPAQPCRPPLQPLKR